MGVGWWGRGGGGGGGSEWIRGVVSFAVCYPGVCQAACFERRKRGAGGKKSAGVFKPQTKMEREFHEMTS